MIDNKYEWGSNTPLVTGGNPVFGQSPFGKNVNNGIAMQPDAYYSSMFLERKRFKAADLVFASYAEKRNITKGNDTINLRRYQPLKAHIVPLVEGLPPAADRAHGKAIIGKVRSYGRFMEFTDEFDYRVADPVIQEYTMELSDLVGETVDMLAQAALLAEAQVFYPVKSGVSTEGTLVDLAVSATTGDAEKARPTFEDLRVMKLTMEVAKVKPIGGVYPVLVSPAVFFDLQTSDIANKYMEFGRDNSPIKNDGIPTLYGISIRKAPTAKTELVSGTITTAKSAMVHHSIMLGAKAYTKLDISGSGNVQFITKGLGTAGTLDPLNQRKTMGWKMMALGFKVTDPDAVIDYISVPSQAELVTDNFDYVTDILGEIGVTDAMAKALEAKDGSVKADGTHEQTFADDSIVIATAKADTVNTVATTLDLEKVDKNINANATVGQFASKADKTKSVGAKGNRLNAKEQTTIKES